MFYWAESTFLGYENTWGRVYWEKHRDWRDSFVVHFDQNFGRNFLMKK